MLHCFAISDEEDWCLLPLGHDGTHEWTPEDDVLLVFTTTEERENENG